MSLLLKQLLSWHLAPVSGKVLNLAVGYGLASSMVLRIPGQERKARAENHCRFVSSLSGTGSAMADKTPTCYTHILYLIPSELKEESSERSFCWRHQTQIPIPRLIGWDLVSFWNFLHIPDTKRTQIFFRTLVGTRYHRYNITVERNPYF